MMSPHSFVTHGERVSYGINSEPSPRTRLAGVGNMKDFDKLSFKGDLTNNGFGPFLKG